jgi:hypothetical protein
MPASTNKIEQNVVLLFKNIIFLSHVVHMRSIHYMVKDIV